MLSVPFVAFWVLIFFGRHELGLKWTLTFIAIWGGLLAAILTLNVAGPYFVAIQAFLDIILILVIFGGDIRIR